MQPSQKGSRAQRFPRRIVRLDGQGETVLEEFASEAVTGKAVHEALIRHAKQQPKETIAAQWLSPLGWTTFLKMGPGTAPPK